MTAPIPIFSKVDLKTRKAEAFMGEPFTARIRDFRANPLETRELLSMERPVRVAALLLQDQARVASRDLATTLVHLARALRSYAGLNEYGCTELFIAELQNAGLLEKVRWIR